MSKFNNGETVRVISQTSSFHGRIGVIEETKGNISPASYRLRIPGCYNLLSFGAKELELVSTVEEKKEDIEDFKNLIPMRIVMKPEEFDWLKKKIEEAEESENLPNLRALANHPPKGAI